MADEERIAVAWLARRVGFGLAPGELEAISERGVAARLDELTDGDRAGVPPNADPWSGFTPHPFAQERYQFIDRVETVRRWFAHMTQTTRPLEEWMRWFWHGHLVSGMNEVEYPGLMIRQLRTYGAAGLGDLRSLLRAATIDPAMLRYLDGAGSPAGAPNENYARELLELFALGVGNYTEADIRAIAAALTGWRIERGTGDPYLDPSIHDDRPQRALGVEGIHDVDTVIDAVVGHSACAPWIVRNLADAILGAGAADDDLVRSVAGPLREDGAIRPAVRRLLDAGIEGRTRPVVWRPVPWLAAMLRATGTSAIATTPATDPDDPTAGRRAGARAGRLLGGMAQVPMFPPNVSGWPGDDAFLGSSATIARLNTAMLVANETAPDAPARQRAADRDWDGLAALVCRPEGFGDATRRGLDSAARAGGEPGLVPLAVALCAPEVLQS